MSSIENPGNSMLPWLQGGGSMGDLIRTANWSATPLGEPHSWPAALKQTVSMMLTTTFPVLVCWGADYTQLYNDAFRPINGESKHPQAMGGSARDAYAEIWQTIGPMFEDVMNGQTVGFPDFMVQLNRNGTPEECYFDFSYSPIRDEQGRIGGILVICMETTEKVRAIADFKSLSEQNAATNEELGAANEEYAATNEELGAVNEELATINEELTETQANLQQINAELTESETRLKAAMITTARSEKLFRSIAVNIPDSLIVMIDQDHRYLVVEGDLMEKMGYEHRDYEGKHPSEISAERYAASKHLFEKLMAGERFSVERKGAAGESYVVHFVPIKNDEGEVFAGMIILFDVTNIKQAEERSAKLAAIVESSDDAIISKTLESVITSWNGSAQRMFGYTADEIVGETIYKLIPADRTEEEPRILARLKGGERVNHFETQRLTKHGKLIDVSLSISPVKDSQGNIIGLSKIARDITERKLDELRKNDFIGMVSHELKTPLTSLNAIIQVANAKLKHSEDTFLAGAMQKAHMQVKRMTAMINGFLNISRLEAGKILIEKQPFELGLLFREILDETRLFVSSHTLTLEECDHIMVNADRDKISSVVSNLVSNAVKYSPKGKLIDIRCQVHGEMVIASVKDEGMGIKPHDLEKIFDRYYRVESNHTQNISGFGIGLYLSAEIIKRHDGEIWAESESGKGSTFYFSLPLQ